MSATPGNHPTTTRRYLAGLAFVAVGLAATGALTAYADTNTLSPVVGAVALACWYGGVGPGLVAAAVGWAAAWFAFADRATGVPVWEDVVRVVVAAAVSLGVIVLTWALRRISGEAVARATAAERNQQATASIQLLTRELATAVTPSDVAHILVEQVPALIGSAGAALGLIDAGELRIVDPVGAPRQTLTPGTALALGTRAPITTAARTGETTVTLGREAFERDFPDGAQLAPYAVGALAVPLHVAGTVVGSMGLPFTKPNAIDDEIVEIAEIAAELGGLALERARLYEHEHEYRGMLERIGSLAPRFGIATPDSVSGTICREARDLFGAEEARIWQTRDGSQFEIVWPQPSDAQDGRPSGDLGDAVRRLEPVFVEGSSGSRPSTLLVPMLLEGEAERVLELRWARVTTEPSRSTMLLARRFADQAALALEHAERRVAQSASLRHANETRRLLDVTAALAAALDPGSVVEAAVEQAMTALGASAGTLASVQADGTLELVGTHGYPESVISAWGHLDLGSERPLAEAIRRNELVAIDTPAELRRRFPDFAATAQHETWLALPLTSGARVVGGLGLSFDATRGFDESDRAFALALSRQAGQALEHALLLEGERDARLRAERMAGELARLHALSTTFGRPGSAADVARTIVSLVVSATDAHTSGLYAVDGSESELGLLEVGGRLGLDELDLRDPLPVEASDPVADSVRGGVAVWLSMDDGWCGYPRGGARAEAAGSIGIVPLLVHERAIGALFTVFESTALPTPEEQRFVETVARQAALPLERVKLLDDERRSRVRAEQANERTERLQRLTTALSGALTPDDVVEILLEGAATVVGASAAGIVILDQASGGFDHAGWKTRGLEVPLSWRAADPDPTSSPLHEALSHPRYFDEAALLAASPDAANLVGDAEHRRFAVAPLFANRTPIAIAVFAWQSPEELSATERALVEAVLSQLGQALDRAQRYAAEQTIAETLQRSVLPETLPSMEGAAVAARYLPGAAAVDVGGDWFDTILLPDGRLGFVVGDVVGKGVQAASAMARLRNGMRALTLDSSDPAPIVSKLNRMLDGSDADAYATLAFVAIDTSTHEATIVSAGHLPPLVISAAGEPKLLDGIGGIPLGVGVDTTYESFTTSLAAGSSLVLYTDGLVERRDRPLDDGLDLLVLAAREGPHDPDELIDHLLDRLVGDNALSDDVAILVVALDPSSPAGAYSVQLPSERESLIELRESFGRWLDRGAIRAADRHDLLLATWEASANAIEHAVEPAEPSITVAAHLSGDRVRVEVSDTGSWRPERDEIDRGLGLELIKGLVTTVAVETGAGGTRVVMERVLSRERTVAERVDVRPDPRGRIRSSRA